MWLLTGLCWNLYPAASAQFLLNKVKRLYAKKTGPSETLKGFRRSKGSLRPCVKFSIYKECTPYLGRSGCIRCSSPPPPREICILHQVLKGFCEPPEKDLLKGFVWRGDYPISGLGYLTNTLGKKNKAGFPPNSAYQNIAQMVQGSKRILKNEAIRIVGEIWVNIFITWQMRTSLQSGEKDPEAV